MNFESQHFVGAFTLAEKIENVGPDLWCYYFQKVFVFLYIMYIYKLYIISLKDLVFLFCN